ncbi:MAG: isoprenylcysteine carboxylmethyltransferase family protein [candidate division Zixibacteria bacterium]|nr:isoprenylcysteine carboxylmethyltransferase family protein [candidate division Zixibacteria bacterium]
MKDFAINFFYRAATSSRKVRTWLTPIGATFFLVITGFFVYLALLVDGLLNLPELLPKPINFVLSIPIFLVGLFIYFWSVRHFFKAKGTPVPFNPPPRIVTGGPYAYCRNPMMSGIFLILFGLGILLRSLSLIVVFTPLYILLNALELKAIEEPELAKRLGEDYVEYKNRTPMFIPRFRGSPKDK